MTGSPLITATHLGKQYVIGANRARYGSLRDRIAQVFREGWRGGSSRSTTFWALRNVDLSIAPGEALGIIGRNGAGKSTLLKLLSRITYPTEGRIVRRGRVASLLEVGTGFHPELTGRENIFMNGAILGMRRAEIRSKFEEIVEFSEISEFLDTPVKRYSSGMYVRLAFAVAAHLESEVILVDEVLAVGDAGFQRKCLDKMAQVARGGRAVILVSHNMAAIESFCRRAVLLERGKLAFDGEVPDAIRRYTAAQNVGDEAIVDTTDHAARTTADDAVVRRVGIESPDGHPTRVIRVGDPVTFRIGLVPPRPLRGVTLGLHLVNTHGHRVVTLHSRDQYLPPLALSEPGELRCAWPDCCLMPGSYSVVVALEAEDGTRDRLEPALAFEVLPADYYGTGRTPPATDGVVLSRATWSVTSA